MRMYISGAVTGVRGYKERFAAAAEAVRERGYVPVNPVEILDPLSDSLSYEEIMGIDMEILKHCEGIYLLAGWERSLGANREYGYALGAGMHVETEKKVCNNCMYGCSGTCDGCWQNSGQECLHEDYVCETCVDGSNWALR